MTDTAVDRRCVINHAAETYDVSDDGGETVSVVEDGHRIRFDAKHGRTYSVVPRV